MWDTDLIGEYIAEGASSVVLSDAIFDKEAMAQRNFNAISRLAHLAALQGNVAVERLKVTLTGASWLLLYSVLPKLRVHCS